MKKPIKKPVRLSGDDNSPPPAPLSPAEKLRMVLEEREKKKPVGSSGNGDNPPPATLSPTEKLREILEGKDVLKQENSPHQDP